MPCRECDGQLIQVDGSDHRGSEDRGGACTLLVFIDAATSTLMELRFVRSESTFSTVEARESHLHAWVAGCILELWLNLGDAA